MNSTDKLYVLNLYATTSGMLLNGKSPCMFLESDLPAIGEISVKYMNGYPRVFEDFSVNVKENLEDLLDCYQNSDKKTDILNPQQFLEKTI